MEDIKITPQLVKEHGLTEDEYQHILKSLGREPTYTELGVFSVIWSEHCSYKSSRSRDNRIHIFLHLRIVSLFVYIIAP